MGGADFLTTEAGDAAFSGDEGFFIYYLYDMGRTAFGALPAAYAFIGFEMRNRF